MRTHITTVIGCKNLCAYCPQGELLKAYLRADPEAKHRLMTMAMFRTIERKLPKKNIIFFCGMSEPFQNPKCTDMILYAYKKGRKIIIFTTLMGLSVSNLKRLFSIIPATDRNVKYVIHLPSKKKLERIVINKSYLNVLSKVIHSNRDVYFHYHGEKLHPLINKLMINSPHFPEFHPPYYRGEPLFPADIIRPARKRGRIKCRCWAFVILPNGSVILCANDYKLKNVLGNISTSSYKDILNSDVIKRIYRSWKNERMEEECRYCYDAGDANSVAQYYNSPFTLAKIPMGLKIYLYNHHQKIFNKSRLLWRFITHNKKPLANCDAALKCS